MLSSKDLNFVGYTYKNFEAVQAEEAVDIGECCIAERVITFCFFNADLRFREKIWRLTSMLWVF